MTHIRGIKYDKIIFFVLRCVHQKPKVRTIKNNKHRGFFTYNKIRDTFTCKRLLQFMNFTFTHTISCYISSKN